MFSEVDSYLCDMNTNFPFPKKMYDSFKVTRMFHLNIFLSNDVPREIIIEGELEISV